MQCAIKQLFEIQKEVWDSFVYANSMGWAYFLYDVVLMDRHANKEDISFCIVDLDNNDEILMLVMKLLTLFFLWTQQYRVLLH